jgi:hypothetical protein
MACDYGMWAAQRRAIVTGKGKKQEEHKAIGLQILLPPLGRGWKAHVIQCSKQADG